MKSAASTALVCIFFYGCLSGQTLSDSQRLPNVTDKVLTGEFLGMEEIKDYEPGKKWFHAPASICYDQNYIGYKSSQYPSANINWNVQIFCSNSPYPSQTVTKSETITCQ